MELGPLQEEAKPQGIRPESIGVRADTMGELNPRRMAHGHTMPRGLIREEPQRRGTRLGSMMGVENLRDAAPLPETRPDSMTLRANTPEERRPRATPQGFMMRAGEVWGVGSELGNIYI